MKFIKSIFLVLGLVSLTFTTYAKNRPAQRWSEEKANEWYAHHNWPVGVNYVCATAINQFEMWQAESFDPKTMDAELGRAEKLGFNTIRVFLHDMVWEADPQGFKERINTFLNISKKHNLQVIMTLFTNGGNFNNPHLGKQPESVQGVHNSQWLQSPGAEVVNDPKQWGRLEKYVKDVLTTFKDDDRILLWCLYNEPENFKHDARSLPLLREVFKWGREVNPSQPLSSPIWTCPGFHGVRSNFPIISFLGENCDVMTFHCYNNAEEMETFIKFMQQYKRPIICQEYMGRPRSTFFEIMPILKREKVGAISWGLTAGKCNFHLQWSSKAGDPEPKVWFHDIFRLDGTPYSEAEIRFIKKMTGKTPPVVTRERWSEKKVTEWYSKWGWLRGCNFIPSTAINQLEMWQAETFDATAIDHELGFAENIGMNCMRVYLHHLAWQIDKEGFKNRMNQYLDIAGKHGISTIFVLFDDCWNPTYAAGTQPDPKPGIHNSGWVRDPGNLLFDDSTLIDTLEIYAKDILNTFRHDKRIVFWDLYNEPGNNALGNRSLPLLQIVFEWGRTINPDQPLSAGVWDNKLKELTRYQLDESDIISYHNYKDVEHHKTTIDSLKRFNRPIICTEYMARRDKSFFQTIMPMLKENNIGAINWGLVAGKTNTIFAWKNPMPDVKEPPVWFHDIFRKDGSVFSQEEIDCIKQLTGKK